MLNVDRHIAIQAGWIAGPAFGVAMMAAPEYLHLGPVWSALLFWGGVAVFLATIAVVAVISLHEERKRQRELGPIILMVVGALVFCMGAAWYFWPSAASHEALSKPASPEANKDLNALDGTVKLECVHEIFTYPEDGNLWELIGRGDKGDELGIGFQRG
jgi:hypothetical protein